MAEKDIDISVSRQDRLHPETQYTSEKTSRPSRSRSRSSGTLSLLSNDDLPEFRLGSEAPSPPPHAGSSSSSSTTTLQAHPSTSSASGKYAPDITSSQDTRRKSWRIRIQDFWNRNYGLLLVCVAQFFATLMNVTTGLLEDSGTGSGMHPFQILFARMSITVLCSLAYMWYTKTPDWPFGARGVRWLLVCRGVGGFFGVFGLYWYVSVYTKRDSIRKDRQTDTFSSCRSLQYLPLSDATVLTFLAPTLACYACSKLIAEPFTRTEQIGGLVSLVGVVLIARPTYLFSSSSSSSSDTTALPTDAANPSAPATAAATTSASASGATPTPQQHLAAIGMALLGVLGAASAYTTIRMIGHRAHPLISVTYFSFWCTLVSFIALTFVPSIPFVLPSSGYQWLLLLFIGVSGFVMQFLLTAGLRAEKSGRATNMIYSQMVFALGAERLIWGTSPGVWSWCGSGLILGAAGMVAMQKGAGSDKGDRSTQRAQSTPGNASVVKGRDEEEEAGMLLHDAEMHQIGDEDEVEYKHDDIEMVERGRSASNEDDDDATIRASIEDADAASQKQQNHYLHPQARPGEWQFQHGRTGTGTAGELESEEVSPHSPSVSRKGPVFWGK